MPPQVKDVQQLSNEPKFLKTLPSSFEVKNDSFVDMLAPNWKENIFYHAFIVSCLETPPWEITACQCD